jgi:Flp pilus assembly protein TadG
MVRDVRGGGSGRVRGSERERGQALVEFALLAPLFLLIVAGIIQFGVALNFWFDMNRIANQGARWAAVNCGQSATVPPANPCVTSGGTPNIELALLEDIVSRGNDATVEVCWVETTGAPAGTVTVGDPVRVQLKNSFEFVPIVGIDVELRATTTMRVEQAPSSSGPLSPSVVSGPNSTPGTACPV